MKKNNSPVNSRSEEVQDIIDRMPTGWTFGVVGVCFVLIALLIGFSFAISYPDTVDGEITVTAEKAPVRLVAVVGGRLHLLRQAGDSLHIGDVIGYIDTGVDYASFRQLEESLRMDIADSLPAFDKKLEIGELSSSYTAYVQAYENWYRLSTSPRNKEIRSALALQIQVDRELARQMQEGIAYKKQTLQNNLDWLRKDSLLLARGLISEFEFQQAENNIRSQQEAYVSARTSHYSHLSGIQQIQSQIIRSRIEEEESVEEAFQMLQSSGLRLKNDIRIWKEKYFFTASTEGVLDYLGFWRENTVVQAGTEVFSILPPGQSVIGEVIIPANGAGKVQVGMPVNIKLSDYPYDEYGMLRGRVETISRLTHELPTQSGTVHVYRVLVSLPDGVTTHYGIPLAINLETKGMAEIITKPRRLIQRLFDNLRARSTK